MPTSGVNRSTYEINTPRTEVHLLFANFIGGAASNPTMNEFETRNGEILSAVRTGTGAYTLTMRYSYPELKDALSFKFIGVTAGLTGRCTAFDPVTGVATVVFSVGAVATDIPTTDTVYVSWAVRGSGKNR